MTVDWVVIHHEGANRPGDVPASSLYSIWIGATKALLQHPGEQDGSTAGLNGKVLGVCFSGHRGIYPISDSDLKLLGGAMAEARSRGWVTAQPRVNFHGDPELVPYGNATDCPGQHTRARRAAIVALCRAIAIPIPTPEEDMPWMLCYTNGKPTWLVSPGNIWQVDQTKAYTDVGIPLVPVPAAENDRIRKLTEGT